MELSRNLKIDSVARLWPGPPRQVEADRPVADAVCAMREWQYSNGWDMSSAGSC